MIPSTNGEWIDQPKVIDITSSWLMHIGQGDFGRDTPIGIPEQVTGDILHVPVTVNESKQWVVV